MRVVGAALIAAIALGASAVPVRAHSGTVTQGPRPDLPVALTALVGGGLDEVTSGADVVASDETSDAQPPGEDGNDGRQRDADGEGGGHPVYALAGRCYALQSRLLDRFVVKEGGGYRASTEDPEDAEHFRLKATDLGEYLLYGQDEDFLAVDTEDEVVTAGDPSDAANWAIDTRGRRSFTITSTEADKVLAVDPDDGELTLVDPDGAGDAARFSFERADGCARYPEIEVNAKGTPFRGTRNGEVVGYVDMHQHLMFFEAIGGQFHCGRPWHRFGVEFALPDCSDIYGPQGSAAPVQNFLNYGEPEHPHDTRGWPTFKDWPGPHMLTYEGVYHRWLERAWRGGLRVYVPLNTDNQVLCDLYQPKKHGCNEMDSVRRQIADLYELQDYIDAQSRGPGRGWFRIVDTPADARRVIEDGKLAVVLGIETSKPLDCGEFNDQPECDEEQIKERLDEVYELGVRQMEVVNKFDNAFGGIAGDGGTIGPVINTGNAIETGHFWAMETCGGEAHDNPQPTEPLHTDIGKALVPLLPPGAVPVYPEPPHCNSRGLTPLGKHLLKRMMSKGMLIDPDHLSVAARHEALAVIANNAYPGVISSHSWSDVKTYPRIYRLGGMIGPYAGSSTSFAQEWRERRKQRRAGEFFGLGYGSDMSGLGPQGEAREGEDPVEYPFKAFVGDVKLDRQRSGEREFDINVDGVAHYGLYPDWIEDLRKIAGDQIARDLSRGAEMYLRVWEDAIRRSRELG